ncbi:Importin subunit beta-1 [Tetrabaena socialis]|uniref:Importin subunit beta-1 n=1 Tax=Tetrabaena socialis TaxID=47790 RepID=A0A2J7ZJT0_9CHLO|nr:Importin subunit beta-1 [Tetrabaena socialis]|eukprot:PNH00526.1 Importin subunit beta-1 [Tetrabaena socialis]
MAAVCVDLSAALASTFSHDAGIRQSAELHLDQLKQTNFPSYLASVTNELGNEERADDVRQAAGLQLKNAVDSKDAARRPELTAKWLATEAALKAHIRDVLLRCLHSPKSDVRKTVALVIAKIASIDVQAKDWLSLIPSLLNNMGAQPPASVGTRTATLLTLGYICEEVDESLLSPEHVNMVLTAVVAGMGAGEADESRLAAIKALTNAIHLAKNNFEVDNERSYLMQVVCQGTQAANQPIRVASFQCLQQIADNYYPKLQAYMTELYGLTTKAIKEDDDEVATQAIEFWSTVAEYELDLLDDGKDSECKNFIVSAADYLLPIVLECLTKQDEDALDDEGTWNRSMAAGFCLKLLARICRDRLVPQVLPFITMHISAADWHQREGATFAFGSIMEGPSVQALDQIVRQGLPFLLTALKDPHRVVRETTAWALGQVFEHVHGMEPDGGAPIIGKDMLPGLLTVLVESLKDEPRVAYYVCDAVRLLALGYHKGDGGGVVESKRSSGGGALVVVLVPSVILTSQHAAYFRRAELPGTAVDAYSSDSPLTEQAWNTAVRAASAAGGSGGTSSSVLVATAASFLNLLLPREGGRPPVARLRQLDLLVLDEAHHCHDDHPFAQVMAFYEPTAAAATAPRPRVLAVTASPASEVEQATLVLRMEQLLGRLGAALHCIEAEHPEVAAVVSEPRLLERRVRVRAVDRGLMVALQLRLPRLARAVLALAVPFRD